MATPMPIPPIGMAKRIEQYTITINNFSESTADYAIYTEVPTDLEKEVATRYFIAATYGVQSMSGYGAITIPKEIYAICGGDNPQIGGSVMDKRVVELGKYSSRLGTTCNVIVSDGDSPGFSVDDGARNGGVGAFCIKTRTDFTSTYARDGGYYVGYGCKISSNQNVVRCAAIRPKPNQLYQVKPTHTFYVVQGDYRPGDVVPGLSDLSTAVKVDFDVLNSDQAEVNHTSNNVLVISY